MMADAPPEALCCSCIIRWYETLLVVRAAQGMESAEKTGAAARKAADRDTADMEAFLQVRQHIESRALLLSNTFLLQCTVHSHVGNVVTIVSSNQSEHLHGQPMLHSERVHLGLDLDAKCHEIAFV